jgi:hypothetical protein
MPTFGECLVSAALFCEVNPFDESLKCHHVWVLKKHLFYILKSLIWSFPTSPSLQKDSLGPWIQNRSSSKYAFFSLRGGGGLEPLYTN